ncbi:chemotaxis protein CheA [Aeromonas hydrophila]|uniref:chemotaxis protein CheA n=1 Tax=Aeromonas hydrophila TaxID=644 RepID=UPI0022AEEBFF|nr:chemotaxis protein CheA [Aeromonas hydrophila]ELB2793110.1 chemotaxis protein CheA [Aeromonas hydrophila]MCZ4331933.1 chemotaxis protein CheA [Aeromonas hydrophila]
MDINKARALFFEEAYEQCDNLEHALLDRDTYPANPDTYNLMFRTAHTIKGSAGMLGLAMLVRFAHAMENMLERLRSGEIALDEHLINLLLACNDQLRDLLQGAEHNPELQQTETQQILALLSQLQGHQTLPSQPLIMQAPAPVNQTDRRAWHLSLRFYPALYQDGFDLLAFIRYLGNLGEIRVIQPVWQEWPPLQLLDATECFLGYEIGLLSAEPAERIRSTFDFVAHASLICLLNPHQDLAQFSEQGQKLAAWRNEPLAAQLQRWVQAGALSEEEAASIARGELTPGAASLAPPIQSIQLPQEAPQQQARPAPLRAEGHYIRIEAAKLDRLINRVGELVIATSATTLQARMRGDAELIESVAIVNTLVEGIRDDALTLRMVPINEIFNRFPRLVHELSQQTGKEIQLQIRNADTDIDKSMVEKLTDPLMHLVRNAADHGLEEQQIRLAAGKPAQGTITLNAYHDAGAVVVEVSDDGRGIDRDKILAKAHGQGLLPEGKVLSEQEIFQLLFLPGFSTASDVSDLSGRGVGLDVVKRNLEFLRGETTIDSRLGLGTTFRLRLPLTLAIIDGFRIEVDHASLVIPLDMMVECIDLPPDALRTPARQINVRGEWVPFIVLRELFALPPADEPEFVVMVDYADHRAGIVVDRLIGEVQAVIKPLGELFKSLRYVSGSTILGNGQPALILDVPQLIQLAWRREQHALRQQADALYSLRD